VAFNYTSTQLATRISEDGRLVTVEDRRDDKIEKRREGLNQRLRADTEASNQRVRDAIQKAESAPKFVPVEDGIREFQIEFQFYLESFPSRIQDLGDRANEMTPEQETTFARLLTETIDVCTEIRNRLWADTVVDGREDIPTERVMPTSSEPVYMDKNKQRAAERARAKGEEFMPPASSRSPADR